MLAPFLLITAGLFLWYWIVPVVQRFGMTPATFGGLIACASTSLTAALVVGGVAVLVNLLY